jgi:tRNA C32,U32 (ribose-2'-O)-methylase TrmJ
MFIDELQADMPDIVRDVEALLSDLQCAASCDNKADFCENIRAAITKATIAKQELAKLLKAAEKCRRYSYEQS